MPLKITPQKMKLYRRADYKATGVGGLILNELLDDIELMIQALCDIGYSDHCRYDKNEASDYGKGVTDGHAPIGRTRRERVHPIGEWDRSEWSEQNDMHNYDQNGQCGVRRISCFN